MNKLIAAITFVFFIAGIISYVDGWRYDIVIMSVNHPNKELLTYHKVKILEQKGGYIVFETPEKQVVALNQNVKYKIR